MRLAGVVVGLVSATAAAAQTPPAAAQATQPTAPPTGSLAPLPPPPDATPSGLPPLPAPTPDSGGGSPSAPDATARVDAVLPQAPHADADTSDDEDASSVKAPVAPDPWATQPLLLEAQVGVGAPLGLLGVAIDYSPVPILGFNLGIGLGLGGVQYAFASRLRVVRAGRRRDVALYVGDGVSIGGFNTEYPNSGISFDGSQGDTEDPVPHHHWDAACWMNPEAGVEIRLGPHVSLRPFAGAEFLLNPGAGVAVNGQHGEAPGPVSRWTPYVGFAVGYAARPGW